MKSDEGSSTTCAQGIQACPGITHIFWYKKSQSISLRGEEEASQKALETWNSATFKLNISTFLLISLPLQRQLLLNIQMLMEQAHREGSQAEYPCPELAFPLIAPFFSFVQCFPACLFLLVMHRDHPNVLLIHLDLYNRLPQP